MNMKILIPIVIAIAVGAVWLLSNAEGDISLGGESHDVAPAEKDKH